MRSAREDIVYVSQRWYYIGVDGPAFGTGWSNHTYPARFMKDREGFLHFAGRIQSSGSTSLVMVVPSGFRPAEDAGGGGALAGYWGSTRQLANWQYVGAPNYELRIYGGNDAVTAMQYIQLETITWKAE